MDFFDDPFQEQGSITFPIRVGAIDAGSNAIRFVVADFQDPTTYTIVARQRLPVRLGHHVFTEGRLDAETIANAAVGFRLFRRGLDLLDVDCYRAVATSATREAENRDELLGTIFEASGIELEPISGTEEAQLVHLAVRSRVDLSRGRWILVDLGGGSVEVSLVDDTGILWTESYAVGTVRLLETLETSAGAHESLRRWVAGQLKPLTIPPPEAYPGPTTFAATGGNIEAIAKLGLSRTNMSQVAILPTHRLDAIIHLLAGMSYEERVTKLGLREDRADVILPAALVYRHFTDLAYAERVVVPNVGLKDGVLLQQVRARMSAPLVNAR